eukprot:CCRYP_018495-RA/>CCRYP_018495-RA protein AED:0.81 eAED:0.81 QI:0/-1/0/1/-1/1/1/0/256
MALPPPLHPQPQSHVSITPQPLNVPHQEHSHVSTTSSIASTIKPPNTLRRVHYQRNKIAARWKRFVQRKQERRQAQQRDLDIMQCIIEQNQRIEQPYDLMTDFPDPDSNSVASNVDSLFDISSPTQGHNTDSYTSSDSSISSESSHTIATCSTTSLDWFENPAPPPPGSLLDLWDTPFSAGTFHDFKDWFQDGRVAMDTTTITEDLTDSDSSISSTSTIDIPAHTAPVLQFVAATTTVVGIGAQGELVDSGGNFNM